MMQAVMVVENTESSWLLPAEGLEDRSLARAMARIRFSPSTRPRGTDPSISGSGPARM